ncbi:acyl-CoA dehydrogenase [Pseudonocardia parietis]|uniref:Acyl-CoA dehydrogenase n=1 Tax=Pseudonocardia parietis TaxID=570936 RepID=A0ABS4VMQ9_9PSEU|nr:acyl-CoA dehydrogenase [Pseudonocardia parietis]MBP2365192.1 acyl-CoA dehydrogenase [Pseudonocardia parietis]
MNEHALLHSTVSAILDEHIASARDEAARDGWSSRLWQLLEEAGFTLLSVPEAAGGTGGGLRDLAVVAQACGYLAAPVPLTENVLAGWALAAAGLAVPRGPLTFVSTPSAASAPPASNGAQSHRVTGQLDTVPWARAARSVVLITAVPGTPERTALAVIDPNDCVVLPDANLADEPRDTLLLPPSGVELTPLPADGLIPSSARLRGALARTLLMTGALRRVLDLTVRYAGEREQFGRPIGQFQAVQQQLAALAGAVEQAQAITDLAVEALEQGERANEAIMAAKTCAGQAAAVAIAVGHQVHGAIGFTTEHELHLHTRRLMAWRDEDGSDSDWSAQLGVWAGGAGPDGLWELLTSHPPVGVAR